MNKIHALTLTIGLDSTWPEEAITGQLGISNHSLVVILSFHTQGDGGTGPSLRFFSKSVGRLLCQEDKKQWN